MASKKKVATKKTAKKAVLKKPRKGRAQAVRGKDILTAKENLFVEKYLSEARFNATEAAFLASYKGNRNTLAVVGFENLRKPKIAKVISERLQASAMSSDEVLMRLAKQARGSLADILDDDGQFDFAKAKTRGVDDLLKKLKITERRFENEDEDAVIETKVEFEIYSSQTALELIGKHHGLFIDRKQITGKDGENLDITFLIQGNSIINDAND